MTPLPPLPAKVQIDKHTPTGYIIYGYTVDQMRAYALDAIAAQGTGVVPELGFMIEIANAGELAAYDYAVSSHCVATLAILDGKVKEPGVGVCNEPWGSVRKRLLDLVNAPVAQPPVPTPVGFLYETKTGFRYFWKAGESASKKFKADREAAGIYPTGHSWAPLYAQPESLKTFEVWQQGFDAGYHQDRL